MSAYGRASNFVLKCMFVIKSSKVAAFTGPISKITRYSSKKARNEHSWPLVIELLKTGTKNDSFKNRRLAFDLTAILVFLGLKNDEESVIKKLFKRGQILLQKGKLNKAEQMYHIALKHTQEIGDDLGINYIYSKLGEIAFERQDYDLTVSLYTTLIRRLLEQKVPESDIQIIHLSFKIANIYMLTKDYEKAKIGLDYCYGLIQPQIEQQAIEDRNNDLVSVWLYILDGFTTYYMHLGDIKNTCKYSQLLYDETVKYHGETDENAIMVLTDLAGFTLKNGDKEKAKILATKAVKLGESNRDMPYLPSIYLTYAHIELENNLLESAEKYAKKAKTLAYNRYDDRMMAYAKECLKKIDKAKRKPVAA